MSSFQSQFPEKSRLSILLEYCATIDDPRDVRRIAHPLAEILLLVVCGTMADCDDYDHIAAWGEAHLDFLRRHLSYRHGVPGGRWLTILMNRINPALFSAAFTARMRETWPNRPDFVAIDGKTSRRGHDRAPGTAPIHLVSAFATTNRLVLGQEAVADKSNELTAIPVLLARLAENNGLRGAIASIDAIATNATIATAIKDAGADYLLADKSNQPTLRAEVDVCFDDAAPSAVDTHIEHDKGHGSDRAAHHEPDARSRLVVGRPPLSRGTASAGGGLRHPCPCLYPARRLRPGRNPLLRIIGGTRRPKGPSSRPRSLGHREQPALGA